MIETSVSVSGQVELHAVHHRPRSDNDKHAGVVLVHGWSGYCIGPHRMFVNAARRFAAEGLHCLRLDLRGRGDSPGDKNDTDLDAMIDDVLAAGRYLRANGSQKLCVLGICSGGNVTLGAGSLDKSIDGLILWSTPLFAPHKKRTEQLRRTGFFLIEYLKKLFRRETYAKFFAGKLNLRLILRILAGKGRGNPRPADGGRNPKDSLRDVMSDLEGYGGRMLFVYGSADDEAAGAPQFYGGYCEENSIPAAFHTVDGANHSYYSLDWENEVIDATLLWLKEL
ncbi:MAG: alpha/beta fold hydrolase [Planctomycetes bacterium]|nr:alpha/beta fold hydrolase [Planctomycetota bacterium]